MNEKVYDVLKYFQRIFLPASICFIGIVMKSLNCNNTDVVVTILTAFDTFLGSVLMISNTNYENKLAEGIEEE